MAHRFDLRQLMINDDKEDSASIDDLLTQVHSILCEREQLWGYINYDLSAKRSKEEQRWERLLNYPGPDPVTLQLLEDHADEWTQYPATFWHGQRSHDLHVLPAMAQIIGCFLQAESDNAWSTMVQRLSCVLLLEWDKRVGSVKETLGLIAPHLMSTPGFGQISTPQAVQNTVDRMVSIGSRYLNLERSLTAGVTLCLGNSILESSWSKRLPKQGPKHHAMIERIRATSISELAPKYKELRVRLVEYRLQTLWAASNSMAPMSTLSSPMAACSPDHLQIGMGHAVGAAFDPMFLWPGNSNGVAPEEGVQTWGYQYL